MACSDLGKNSSEAQAPAGIESLSELADTTNLGAFGGQSVDYKGPWLRSSNGAINAKSQGLSISYWDKNWNMEFWADHHGTSNFKGWNYYVRCPEYLANNGFIHANWKDQNGRYWGWYDPQSPEYGFSSREKGAHLLKSDKIAKFNAEYPPASGALPTWELPYLQKGPCIF